MPSLSPSLTVTSGSIQNFAERIPDNALVAMLVEGDEAFNRWSQEGAKRQAEKDQPIVYVKIKRIQPIRSRIQEIELSA